MARPFMLIGVSLLVFATIFNRYYVPVPEGFSAPLAVGALFTLVKTVNDITYGVSCITGYNQDKMRGKMLELVLTVPTPEDEHLVKAEDLLLSGVPVRVYTPVSVASSGGLAPVVLFFHGGGFTIGGIESYHLSVHRLSLKSGIRFISVGYRLAPEHPYPAAFDDCLAVTSFILQSGHRMKIDSARVGIMGDSAGGNLAAAIAYHLRTQKKKPRAQILIYPFLQMIDLQTPSYQQNGEAGYIIHVSDTHKALQYYAFGGRKAEVEMLLQTNSHMSLKVRQQYGSSFLNHTKLPYKHDATVARISSSHGNLPEDQQKRLLEPNVSPLLVNDLRGLPDTYVYTSVHDIVRDDGLWYADRLRQVNVSVELFDHDRGFHGIMNFASYLQEADESLDRTVSFIHKHL